MPDVDALCRRYRTVYRAVREDAREWWYHRELRAWGQTAEAWKREHANARSSIKALRAAKVSGFLTIGRGGTALHYEKNARIEGLHPGDIAAAILYGIRTVDTRTIPNSKIVDVAVSWPIPVTDDSDRTEPFAPTGKCLAFCRISEMLLKYREVGATLYNCNGAQ